MRVLKVSNEEDLIVLMASNELMQKILSFENEVLLKLAVSFGSYR